MRRNYVWETGAERKLLMDVRWAKTFTHTRFLQLSGETEMCFVGTNIITP